MFSLALKEGEHIRDYVHRVEIRSRKLPKDIDSLFAISFIKRMNYQEREQRVRFYLKDNANFYFANASSVVKFSFQEIGEPDQFRPQSKSQEPNVGMLYSAPSVAQVNIISKADIPTPNMTTLPIQPVMT